jgi:AcrR family transcriptional regulator
MARRSTSKQAINTKLQAGRKSTQRERLIAGVIAVANRDGYSGASISAVSSEAKVSRVTFYEYFKGRDDCFVAALNDVAARLLGEVRAAVAAGQPADATIAGMRTIIAFAGSEPVLARFLTNEPLAAGSNALDARDQGIAEIAHVIEAALESAPPDASSPDIPIAVVIGGLYRLLASRLRRGERATPALQESILDWIRSYAVPITAHRWRSMQPAAPAEPSPYLPRTALRAPEALSPGRPTLSEVEVEANQRLRIIFAAASLADEKGYTGTTITEIAKRARVDLRAFYTLFSEKREAFMAVHELGFEELMSVTAVAFFAGAAWPERSWDAGRAVTQFLEANPTIANVGFVEAYAIGPGAAQRIEDSHVAFTIFLQEGLQYSSRADLPSRVALEVIVNSIFELVYRQVRTSRPPQLSGLLPNIASLWLAPFLGPLEANRFIDGKASSRKATRHLRKTT